MGEAIKMPAFARAAEVRAGSYDETENTVEVIWTTGAPVRRRSWRDGTYYDEVLVVDNGAVRLDRLNAGAPLLDTHDSWSLDSVIGAVVPGSAEIRGGKGYAKVRLSTAPKDADRVQKIRDGIVRNISVGYLIHRVEKIERGEGQVAEWRVVDWEPMEISAVPVPADPGAQVRSGGNLDDAPHSMCVIETRSVAQTGTAAATQEIENMTHNETAAAGEERGITNEETITVKQTNEPAEKDVRSAPVDTEAAERAAREAAERAAREAADAAVRAERERISSIRSIAEKFGVRDFADEHIASGTDVVKFRELLIDHLAEREAQQPQVRSAYGANVHVGEVNPERRAAAIENALLHRADPVANPLTDDGRDFRGMSLIELARDALEARGVRTRGMSKMEVAARALELRTGGLMSTSDFPIILSNVANKTLRQAYEAAPQTFRPLVRETTVSDFKPVTRAQLGEAPSFDQVGEHGEFTRGSIGEAGESYRILTYGKIVGITRQVIVNDDLEAFTRLPRMFGVQAAQLESDLVWSQILGNPTMGDGVTLFHANHKNLASPGAAISATSVGAARAAMAKQTGLDGKTVLNVSPSYIIVPVALQTVVEQFLGQTYATKPDDAVPSSMKALVPIAEPRLDNGIPRSNIQGDAKAWYLAASPGLIDVVELAYLEGQRGVYTDTRVGFDIDGVEVKVRLDVGAKVIDWRGLYKNTGPQGS